MPAQITGASALPGKTGSTKIAFFTRRVSALPEFNQVLLDFFSHFDSRLIVTLLCDSLNLVINAWGFWEAWFKRKEVESAAAVGLCCMHEAPLRRILGFLFCKVMLKHFLSNTSAKNYCCWIVYVKIIASQRWDVFLRHSVHHLFYTVFQKKLDHQTHGGNFVKS